MNEPATDPAALSPETLAPEALDLRDIHLPDPVSWWPIAPGWWLVIVSLLLIVLVFFVIKKIRDSRRLRTEIRSELETIKQQFKKTQNKSQLAKSLSILLRRASISYYPKTNIAGLIGDDWLAYLDRTARQSSADMKFQSNTGSILLSAPYLPDNSEMNYDHELLIRLCESWLLSSHKTPLKKSPRVQTS